MSQDLRNGKYKEGPVRDVEITYPKPRTARSITYRDRSYQRGLNDLVLYPAKTKSFIWANLACQKGKGTEAALKLMKHYLHCAWLRWRTNEFQILSGDIKGYYDHMVHSIAEDLLHKGVDDWTFNQVRKILHHQYKGDMGYNPGSQAVQIVGISYLNPFDHYVKEQLHRRYYLRYMDDWHILGAPDEDMSAVKAACATKLAEVGLELHPVKTKIRIAKEGVVFLGFLFRVTGSGKVVMSRDPKRVKEICRRLRRLAKLICKGGDNAPTWEDFDRSFECVMACIRKGNSRRLEQNMVYFASQLKGGADA